MISRRLYTEETQKVTGLSADQLNAPAGQYLGPRRRSDWTGTRYWLEEDVIVWLNNQRR